MAFLAPDEHDILRWKLDETIGVYRNTGTLLPNNASTDLTVVNAVDRVSTGILGLPCPNFPGTNNFPTGSSATRNSIIGAKTINPTFPITLSCWVNLRFYSTANNATLIGKQFRDTAITNTWTAPLHALNITLLTTNGGQSWRVEVANSTTTKLTFTIDDFAIPLQQWSHIGLTYDGYALKAYLNGCECIYYSSGVQPLVVGVGAPIVYTNGTDGYGDWVAGAITATGSANKEEANYMIQDIRVANIARTPTYFKTAYTLGASPVSVSAATQYYKLRAYDSSCATDTPVTWIDTEISLVNAPAFPCEGPYINLEILSTWFA